MVYRAKHVTQWDGSALAAGNCRMAVAATHLDYHTQGAKTSTGGKMRSFQDDQSGGTDSQDAQKAWARGYGETLVIRDGYTWDKLEEDRAAGRFIELDVLYSILTNRCQEASNFGHTIGIAPESRNGQWLVSDPLCGTYKYMDPPTLRKAAEAWGVRVYGQGFSPKTLGCEPLASLRAAGKGSPRPGNPEGGTRYHSGKTGGTGTVPARIRYTTSVASSSGSESVLKVYEQLAEAPQGTDFYYAPGGERVGEMSRAATVDIVAVPMDKSADHINWGWRAVKVFTQALDGETAWKIVYFQTSTLQNIRAKPPQPSGGDCTDAVAQRDAQWVAHLTPPKP
jgi:hypothetical protein